MVHCPSNVTASGRNATESIRPRNLDSKMHWTEAGWLEMKDGSNVAKMEVEGLAGVELEGTDSLMTYLMILTRSTMIFTF